MNKGPSRITAARGRAAAAKRLLVTAAAAMFAAVLVGVRVSHPGEAAAASTDDSTAVDQASNDIQEQDFDFGQSDIGPADLGSAGQSAGTHAS